ncbi:MAG: aldehyde dehydrogenase [Sphingobacteriia bacterium]|nr:aldehyde dehydrogenase [Sphingobacteriia bacterium]
MQDNIESMIDIRLANIKSFFSTNQTKSISFRLQQLRNLKEAILKFQPKLEQALWEDLHKSPEEAYLTEISIVLGEIDNHIRHLKKWSRPKKVLTPIHLLPSSSRITYEPLGIALIIAPWNYPFQLLFNPLVGAISAGCCAVLKPSPDSSKTATVMEEIITSTFPADYITLIQGRREVNTLLLQKQYDVIFFTGSPALGKIVMKAASEHLTPVVLELGGKSPCIVDHDANIQVAAKRIAWGKMINAGQTCIAPDYLLVHENVKDDLLNLIDKNIREMYGEDIKKSRFYPRIVSDRAIQRLLKLLEKGTIYTGGDYDINEKYISPTIIDNITPSDPVMQEEIFGPILPVMTFNNINEVIKYINDNEKPLAFYYFGTNSNGKDILLKTTSGGGCINDTLMHIANHHLPFGGVGNSGMGKYHGLGSFLAFSNSRAIVSTPTWIDLPLKYVPFKYFRLIKWIIG